MIILNNVSFSYDKGKEILHDINLHIRKGEKTALIGANGAGKSTLIKALVGLISVTGSIAVSGMEVSRKNLAAIRQKTGLVLQNSDNQMFMPTVYDDMRFGPLNYGISGEETERRIDEVLEKLEISSLKNRQNHKLSGGEKKMASIATILVMDPDTVIMDEPCSSLDPYNRRKVINIIKSLEKTLLIASHDLDMILETCERTLIMKDGRIVADGQTKELLKNRELLENNRLELPLKYQL